MQNFNFIGKFDIETALKQVLENESLWNQDTIRTSYSLGTHQEVDDIILRFNKPSDKVQDYFDGLEMEWRSSTRDLYHSVHLTLSLLRLFNSNDLGRVVISRLRPGAQIGTHKDEGLYAKHYSRYHIVYQAGGVFNSGFDTLRMKPGEVWSFNHHLEHSVFNDSSQDRIHLIVDLKP